MHEIHPKIVDFKDEKIGGSSYKNFIAAQEDYWEQAVDNEEVDYYNFGANTNTRKHFSSREEARDFLFECFNKDCDNSYYCTYDLKRSAKYVGLKDRLEAEQKKLLDYEKAHSCNNFKSALIGCERCTSKINKKYIKENTCPVCGHDLRSKTTIETVNRYLKSIEQLKKDLLAEEKVMATGKTGKYNTMGTLYLLSVDTHV